MKNTFRIIISIIIFIAAVLSFDCIFGFTIGGVASWLHLLLSVIFGAVISFLLSLLIKSAKEIKSEKFVILFAVMTIIFVATAKLAYNPFNIITAGDNIDRYNAEIVEIEAVPTVFIIDETFKITLKDNEDNLITVKTNSPAITCNEGDILLIEETKVGFGYSQYEIVN